jgi:hypothetical protein
LANRSFQRPFAGATFEWAGALAPLSFWACNRTTGAMTSNTANVATMTISARTMNAPLSFRRLGDLHPDGIRFSSGRQLKTPGLSQGVFLFEAKRYFCC